MLDYKILDSCEGNMHCGVIIYIEMTYNQHEKRMLMFITTQFILKKMCTFLEKKISST